MKKKIIYSSSFFVILLVAIIIFCFIFFTQRIDYDNSELVKVTDDIKIKRNDKGVPEITVSNEEDLYFAFGYIHAQDRSLLMEYYRAVASAELSTLLGKDGLEIDNLVKILGLIDKSKQIIKTLSPKHKSFLNSYVYGINSIRNKLFYKRRIERDWNNVDVIAILLLKEWANSFLSNKEFVFSLPEKFKTNRDINNFFPQDLLKFYKDDDIKKLNFLKKIRQLVVQYIGTFNRGAAVYLSSNRSADSNSKIGFSYDDSFDIYPGWYPVSVKINDKYIKGITFSGLPFIFSGKNKKISFVGFNIDFDTQNIFFSSVRKKNDTLQYLNNFKWKKFKPTRVSVLLEKEEDNLKKHSIIWETEHGPILNGIFGTTLFDEGVLSLKSFYPKGSYVRSLFSIPFAKNRFIAKKIVSNVYSFPKVYLFSDKNGALKIYSGKIQTHKTDRSFYLKNSNKFNKSSLYGSKNLTKYGFIGSSLEKELIYRYKKNIYFDQNKTKRIEKLLKESFDVTNSSILKIMNDNYSLYAEYFVPQFLSILNNIPITSARLTRIYFNDWNFEMNKNLVAPSIYHVLVKKFIYETLHDELGDSINDIMVNYKFLIPSFYKLIVEKRSKLFDDKKTEKTEFMENSFDKAFLATMRSLFRKNGPVMSNWLWGNYTQGAFNIPLSTTSIFTKFMYKIENRSYNGGFSTVLNTDFESRCKMNSISSLVGVIDYLNISVNLNLAYSINPFSKFYYGKMDEVMIFDLSNIKEKYCTTIKSKKTFNKNY